MSDSEEETFSELPIWAHFQKKTFTKWCNEQLKVRSLEIADLKVSLKDGLLLLNLVELLTHKQKATRHNKKPRIKPQMVENIGIALRILTDDGVKLVNIGNEDIYAGNMKLILGLIWTLILRYQISVDFQKDGKEGGVSAKKELMNWAANLVNNLPGVHIKNFTTDWNDGLALCSMVEAVAPGLCPEYASLDPKNALVNAQLGLDRAEEGLGVPKIIEAEDLINPNIDELSVLTYVSLLKNAVPNEDIIPFDPLKVTIYGPGTDTAFVNTPTHFFIDTRGAGRGELKVTILDSNGDELPSELWKNEEGETKVQYTPLIPGDHNFTVTYGAQAVPNGQFKVKVLLPSDATKVKLSGEGISTAYVGKTANFTVDAEGAGEGPLGISIVSPSGKIPCNIKDLGNNKYNVEYVPEQAGPTLIAVKWCDVEVDDSPINVEVLDDIDPLKVIILTKGLENVVARQPVSFVVCTAGAGNGELKVKVLDENDEPLKVTIEDIDSDNEKVTFTPDKAGRYKVSVTWSNQPVPNGEIELEAKEPIDLSKCIISELTNPLVGSPTHFTVDISQCGSDVLSVSVMDPHNEPLDVTIVSVGEGKYQVAYTADMVGPHRINVKIEDMHVPGSAFSVHSVDPRKVLVTFEANEVPVDEPVEIGLSLSDAGPGQLGIQLTAPPGSGTDCHATEVAPGKMVVLFTPTSVGDHLVNLTFDDKSIPNTPVTVKVIPKSNAGAVVVAGDGISNGNVGEPASFTIDTNAAGPGAIDVKINGPTGELEAPVIEVGQGLYEVTYIPKDEGTHFVGVKFADQHVPGSAFRPMIEKAISPDSVVAYGKGLEEGTPGTDNEFYVDTSKAGEGDLKIEIVGPDGVVQPNITNITNQHYKVIYAVPSEGDYTVNIVWSDVHIPKSPFNINVRTPFNPSSVLATGPGLMYGTVGKVSLFEVDCRAAGSAPLNINVEDDNQNLIPVRVVETQPDCYDVSFVPNTAILHHVNVLWNDFNIRGSPFKINVLERPEKDINLGGEGKIRVYYSTTTSSEKIRHNCRFLQSLLERKKVHLRPDFEPWIPIDIGMDREERNKIFEKAECRKTPMLFIDDQYVGGYDEVMELDEIGEMDRLLSYCTLKYRNLQTIEEARKADELHRRAENRDSL